jgi:hypothetical protein
LQLHKIKRAATTEHIHNRKEPAMSEQPTTERRNLQEVIGALRSVYEGALALNDLDTAEGTKNNAYQFGLMSFMFAEPVQNIAAAMGEKGSRLRAAFNDGIKDLLDEQTEESITGNELLAYLNEEPAI